LRRWLEEQVLPAFAERIIPVDVCLRSTARSKAYQPVNPTVCCGSQGGATGCRAPIIATQYDNPQVTWEGMMSSRVESTVELTMAAGSGKPLVRMFLSYAERDAVVVGRLWELLTEATEVDRAYQFELWRFDEAIRVGEDWDAQTRDALAVSELGLLAVSNAFLRSTYITDVELPALVDVTGKRAIPVSVRRPSRHADLHGLEGKQIYGYQRPFAQVRGPAAQQAWVNDLVDQLHRVLARYNGAR
jgi:TIR domain